MTKIEIIDYVVNHFSTHPRAVMLDKGCSYLTEDGRRCAHSICLTDEALDNLKDEELDSSAASHIIARYGDIIHKEEMRGHDYLFWNAVQSLHDFSLNWEDQELSKIGRNNVDLLKEQYK